MGRGVYAAMVVGGIVGMVSVGRGVVVEVVGMAASVDTLGFVLGAVVAAGRVQPVSRLSSTVMIKSFFIITLLFSYYSAILYPTLRIACKDFLKKS